MTQRFKANDPKEQQVIDLFMPTLETLGDERDAFFAGAFASYLLGDVLYDLDRDPMVGVIGKDLYRSSFPAIHDLFTRPGTFEFYLALFRSIFTDDTDIEFTILAPGHLVIDVTAVTREESYLMARTIVDGSYVYDRLVTSDLNDPIMAQGFKGPKSESEIRGLVSEISAYGVFTEVNLIEEE
jgi:hypothetical protein